jgi:hypothetical protein
MATCSSVIGYGECLASGAEHLVRTDLGGCREMLYTGRIRKVFAWQFHVQAVRSQGASHAD